MHALHALQMAFNWVVSCSMARLDRVKNLASLAEWYAANKRLRKLVNLVIIGEQELRTKQKELRKKMSS